jgi:RNA polymerase sigma-70 factor (ECF subfamily)
MTDYLNDEEVKWMLAVQKGDQIAFRKIVEKYQNSLLNFFYYMNASRQESEDLVQETFLKVYLYREKYSPTAKLSTFLFRVARNTGIDYIRKKKAIPMSFEGDLLESPDSNSHSASENDWQGALEKALHRLPEKLRTVVVMSYFEDLKQQEIADILEVPLGTVKSRMSFAMKQLKDLMESKNGK